MIELIVYPKPESAKLINNSPFCAKSEIYLRLNNIEHKVTEFKGNPSQFPNKKLPVISHNDKIIPDSSWIQKYVDNAFDIDMDSHLSNSQKAQGFAFTKMCEEYLYWSLLHERWFIDANWKNLVASYFDHIPALIRGPITNMIRKATKKSAIGHGMSRHTDEHIHTMGTECLKAISDFMGDHKFLLGDRISSYDATIYAFISSVLHSPLGPKLKAEAEKFDNLVAYDSRMYALTFLS
ncbi:MAG: glutathione S-transferase family protein [Bdellovibrionaceae bacterium]|nr:glutathione S-transferase family protein [Pseudobdellovibrionaceae bacterium]